MLGLLSNVTINGPFLKGVIARECGEEVYTAPGFDSWAQELFAATFGGNRLRAVFLILHGSALIGDNEFANRDTVKKALDPVLQVIATFVKLHPELPLFVSSIDLPRKRTGVLRSMCVEFDAMHIWRTGLEELGVPILELADIAATMGRETFYSARMWYLGGLPFSMKGEKALAHEVCRAWRALTGRSRKCLILDLDNTLWGGVVGEDGVERLLLSESGEGGGYRDFQRRLLALQRRGVLLAVVTKNNSDDALSGIRHPAMLLEENDFVAIHSGWGAKADAIVKLAGELNMGLDAFVFIDDNPVEREAVKERLPEVAVPGFPGTPDNLPAFADAVAEEYFPALRLSAEDRIKTEFYRAEAKRVLAKSSAGSLDEYLASLAMTLSVRIMTEADLPRAAQMVAKTNQFNMTTARYTEGELRLMLRLPCRRMWMGAVDDRLGGHGDVILAFAEFVDGVAVIDQFLMSCRVMDRGIEYAFLAQLEKALGDGTINAIHGLFRPTPKNTPAAGFWSTAGYSPMSDDNAVYIKTAPFAPIPYRFISIV